MPSHGGRFSTVDAEQRTQIEGRQKRLPKGAGKNAECAPWGLFVQATLAVILLTAP